MGLEASAGSPALRCFARCRERLPRWAHSPHKSFKPISTCNSPQPAMASSAGVAPPAENTSLEHNFVDVALVDAAVVQALLDVHRHNLHLGDLNGLEHSSVAVALVDAAIVQALLAVHRLNQGGPDL